MQRATLFVVLALSLAVSCLAQDCDELVQDLRAIKKDFDAKVAETTELKRTVDQLKGELSSLQAKLADAEKQVTTTQATLKAAESKLATTEKKLTSAESNLKSTKSQLSRTESDLSAAKAVAADASGAGETCKLSLSRAESRITEQASRLKELQAVEEALLPVWLSRRLVSAQTWTAVQLKALQESDIAAELAAKAAPYWEKALEVSQPYWDKALEVSQPAREMAGVYYKQAKDAFDQLPVAEALSSAKQQISVVEGELQQTIKAFVSTHPSMAALNDPVVLQLLVYTVLGLPLLLLAVVLLALVGGPGKSAATAAGATAPAKGKKGSGGAAGTGAKKPTGGAAGRTAGKAAVQQSQGRAKGRAVRDGSDVLYTP